jgi:hypothetical protein
MLAMTKSAEAEVVYTPANISIPANGSPVLVDLNHDGVTDFAFWNRNYFSSFSGGARFIASLYVGCGSGNTCQNQGNEVWGRGVGSRYGRFASALRPGFSVGPNKSYFQPGPKGRLAKLSMFYSYQGNVAGSITYGQWQYTQHRYLGLQFMISGQVHYGWARVAVTRDGKNGIVATLTGYAYETIPGKPIIAGQTKRPHVGVLQPTTLGRLAQGASGHGVTPPAK